MRVLPVDDDAADESNLLHSFALAKFDDLPGTQLVLLGPPPLLLPFPLLLLLFTEPLLLF